MSTKLCVQSPVMSMYIMLINNIETIAYMPPNIRSTTKAAKDPITRLTPWNKLTGKMLPIVPKTVKTGVPIQGLLNFSASIVSGVSFAILVIVSTC